MVTPHHLATAAAVAALDAGGNAVDAAIAADAVLGVVAPETCGIGGDLFALVHRPGDRAPAALNASGRAGSGVDAGRCEMRATPRSHGTTRRQPRSLDALTVGWRSTTVSAPSTREHPRRRRCARRGRVRGIRGVGDVVTPSRADAADASRPPPGSTRAGPLLHRVIDSDARGSGRH